MLRRAFLLLFAAIPLLPSAAKAGPCGGSRPIPRVRRGEPFPTAAEYNRLIDQVNRNTAAIDRIIRTSRRESAPTASCPAPSPSPEANEASPSEI